jgi:CRP-like cAMP-binding protein
MTTQVSVFNKFTEEQFDYVVSKLRKVEVAPNDTIIYQGTEGDEFFMLVEGVSVITRKNNPSDPKEVR